MPCLWQKRNIENGCKISDMSSPVGHSLVALTLYTVARQGMPSLLSWPVALILIVLASLPDMDMGLIWFFGFPRLTTHRTFTHSLLFAVVAGIFAAWIYGKISRKKVSHLWWLFPLVVVTHPLMDMTCLDTLAPYGVQLFWPFSPDFSYLPLPFMVSLGSYLGMNMSRWQAWGLTLLYELPVFGTMLLLACRLRDYCNRRLHNRVLKKAHDKTPGED
jgi:membrane-bound metal-dependent hydrolase YbcI (DUF457 family)